MSYSTWQQEVENRLNGRAYFIPLSRTGLSKLLFLVNTNGVLNKTIDNLTNMASNKYLYSPQIEIDGERIEIKQVQSFPKIKVRIRSI